MIYLSSGEPLIFIEVALMKNVAQTIQVDCFLHNIMKLEYQGNNYNEKLISGSFMGRSPNTWMWGNMRTLLLYIIDSSKCEMMLWRFINFTLFYMFKF